MVCAWLYLKANFKWVSVWINCTCGCLTTLWKSCWFSIKAICAGLCVSLTFTEMWLRQWAIPSLQDGCVFMAQYVYSVWKRSLVSLGCDYIFYSSANYVADTNKRPPPLNRDSSDSGGVPPLWGRATDLLPLAQVRGPSVLLPIFSKASISKDSPPALLVSLNKSKQITFPALGDLQPPDSGARQRTTATQHGEKASASSFSPHLCVSQVVMKALWLRRADARRDQPDSSGFSLQMDTEHLFLVLTRCYRPDTALEAALREKYETLAGSETLTDATELPHFSPHAPEPVLPEEALYVLALPFWESGQCLPL